MTDLDRAKALAAAAENQYLNTAPNEHTITSLATLGNLHASIALIELIQNEILPPTEENNYHLNPYQQTLRIAELESQIQETVRVYEISLAELQNELEQRDRQLANLREQLDGCYQTLRAHEAAAAAEMENAKTVTIPKITDA